MMGLGVLLVAALWFVAQGFRMPYAIVPVVMALYASMVVARNACVLRGLARRVAGLCPDCGYDLRERKQADVCPECGCQRRRSEAGGP